MSSSPTQDLPPSIFNNSKEELVSFMHRHGLPSFTSNQVWGWLYKKGARRFEDMTNLSLSTRSLLSQHFTLNRPTIKTAQTSRDGTQKWLLSFEGNHEVETVHIPDVSRGTLCLSSQVGCLLTCKFCHTGTQLFVRNLESSEILGQVMLARDAFNDWDNEARRHITNIVFMGMGEPLYNYDNVSKALKILLDGSGIAFSKRKITVSTAGVVPFIKKCGEELGVGLAISLHAVTNELRNTLVPLNKRYPLEELLDTCANYPLEKGRRITFEYIMLKDVNDSDSDAKQLAKILRKIPSKINLIPFNPWKGSTFECSPPQRIHTFAEILYNAGYVATIREARGQDILAACGQLKSASERERKCPK